MARKKAHTPEEIAAKLRRVEFGGLKLDEVKRLKALEQANARLRKAVSDLTLENVILKEAASGKW